MKEFTYVITDEQGIHARPAGMLVKEVNACGSEVTITKDGKEVNAKSILSLMSLGAKKGNEITIKVTGGDEDASLEKLSAFLKENL